MRSKIKIVSGGQTGADRAALDFALAHDVPHGGWCPKGRRAEDGQLAPCYRLEETPSSEYLERTEWNVRDSDGTVIFSTAAILSGGSKRTLQLAFKLERPVLHLARDDPQRAPEVRLVSFIEQHHIKVVNVAGPRASEEPEVAAWVREVLEKAWDLGGL